MRVAVTGAAGMIGRALVEALGRDDEVAEVVAIDRRPLEAGRPKVHAVLREMRDPRIAADLAGVDALIDLAFCDHDNRTTVPTGVAGSRNAAEAAIQAGAGAILYASSSAVYGSAPDNPVPLDEGQPLRPAAFGYPRTKVAVEEMLEDMAARDQRTRIVRLRPCWVIGPGARVLFGRRAYVSLSDYDPPVQLTWIDDAVAAFTAALHSNTASGAFNVGAPKAIRASEIAGLMGVRGIRLPYRVRRAAAATATRLRIPGALHPGFVDMDRYPIVLDAARAERELGWRPRHDTPEALRRFRETA